MAPMSLFSHPHKLLRDHAKGVSKRALRWGAELSQKEQELLRIIALSHDLGKATRYFQEYLFKKRPQSKETHHALLGALFSFALAQQFDERFFQLLAFVLPKRHHTNLHDFYYDLLVEDVELVQKQFASIDKEALSQLLHVLSINTDLGTLNIEKTAQQLRSLRRYVRTKEFSIQEYLLTLHLFSLLLDADKSDVVLHSWHDTSCSIDPSTLKRYIDHLASTSDAPINRLRNQAFAEVLQSPLHGSIFTLTLPTGLGKTLLSMLFALRQRPKRIIYVLPFLSIIEQNYEAIKRALEWSGVEVKESLLLKHHHLSEYRYRDDEEFDFEASRLLVSGWDAQIVVTTFMQFFHTIIGYKNANIRRFHRLAKSFIILDEPQTLPARYWQLFEKVLQTLTQTVGCKILLTTATKPLIFDDAIEIAKQDFATKLNRYTIYIHKEPMELEEFFYQLKLRDRTLFIFNTIQSAKNFYQMLDIPKKLFLSTHVVPKERLARIQAAKEAQVVVSTQLIEAGVDLDFPVLYRDFAPLDSIIQSAGRCNRHGRRDMGEVHLLNLRNENGRSFASFIYDPVLLDITQKVLKDEVVQEAQIASLCERYYQEIVQRKSDFASKELLEAIGKLRFQAPQGEPSIADFVLIEEEPYKRDVFIELDEEAKEVWQAYRDIWRIEDLLERKSAFLKIKSRFYDYVVSVPVQKNEPPVVDNFYYVSHESLQEYYDAEFGFITQRSYFEF